MSTNANMRKAAKEKNDEFYTRYEDIEKECMRYCEQFHGKTILCNCDDPEWSNFWQFFHRNFSFFQLKKLISTHYVESGSSYAQIYDGTKDKKEPLNRDERIDNNECMSLFDICSFEESNGDFRSPECIKYLEEADIIVTNPPFSLFREFITTLIKYDKKFLVIGNFNAVCCKEIFPLIKNNKLWLGYNGIKTFIKPDGSEQNFGNISWYTNLENSKRIEEQILWKEYNKEEHLKYDNYNAININKMADMPCNYFGYMGVPISIVCGYNPNQFEIIGLSQGEDFINIGGHGVDKKFVDEYYKFGGKGSVSVGWKHIVYYENNKPVIPYWRIIIRRKYDNEGRLVRDFYDEDGNLIK